MYQLITLYKENKKVKFYLDVFIYFFVIQVIYGYGVSAIDALQRHKFCLNLLFLSYVLYVGHFILEEAKSVSARLYKKVCFFMKIYAVLSIFITSFLFLSVQTPFSYFGMLIGNIFIHHSACDFLCLPFRFLLFDSLGF